MPAAETSPTARIAIVGDVMLGRLVSREIGQRSPESFWGDTLPLLRGADAVVANLECAISARGAEWSRTPKVFHFRAAPAAIEVLKAAGVSYVSLANNHVLDYGEEALLDTLDLLDEAGIARAGAGRDLAEAKRAAQFAAGRLRVADFSITDNEPPFAATASSPGTCHVDPAHDAGGWPTAEAIAAERAAGVDLVLVSAHLGPNMVLRPGARIQAFKRRLIEAGGDLLHGHSAHLFQGIEAMGRRTILHDTGDFLDDYAVDPILRNDWSFLFLAEIDAGGVRRLDLRPVRLGFATVNLARGTEAEAICARMIEESRRFGVELTPTGDGLELILAG